MLFLLVAGQLESTKLYTTSTCVPLCISLIPVLHVSLCVFDLYLFYMCPFVYFTYTCSTCTSLAFQFVSEAKRAQYRVLVEFMMAFVADFIQ